MKRMGGVLGIFPQFVRSCFINPLPIEVSSVTKLYFTLKTKLNPTKRLFLVKNCEKTCKGGAQ